MSQLLAISKDQIRRIHVLKGRARLPDDDYRAMLQRDAGVSSSTALTFTQAETVIAGLLRLVPSDEPVERRSRARQRASAMAGPYAPKLRALWISGWNLGVVRDRRDAALLAFCERQTGITHARFLVDQADARKAIEALKAMLARAGVIWPKHGDFVGRTAEGEYDAALAAKRAIVAAQQRLLIRHGRRVPEDRSVLLIPADEIDRVQAMLGEVLRQAAGGPA